MQNMPVPKIIIQSCAFYRHRYISTAVNTSLGNLSLVFKTVFILLITLLKIFYGAIFSILIYSQSPSTFWELMLPTIKLKTDIKLKKLNKYTCTGIDFILEKNNTWALFIIQTRKLSNSFDKANQDSRVFCPRLLFLVPVYYVKKQIFGNALTRSCAQN